ncbi:hypothetical protein LTS18_003254 [Coniosporium uncinatum]|uniref:Uncharacterized protein n=1 Tax=Coniosporium uncinatum TaxID=93489 RepID=A0ACC3DTJ6_9PEZI|nr:hypothetical protein LTS18_003254 [Coniosporium uncinatum]
MPDPQLLSKGLRSAPPHISLLSTSDNSDDDWSADTSQIDDIEDYDTLRPNPATIVEGSAGGGTETMLRVGTPSSTEDDTSVPQTQDMQNPHGATTSSPRNSKNGNNRRRSVQVILEETNKKGRYVLTADDPELRELLRHGIEKEAAALDASDRKKRLRVRDLVFTRQFTTFDRQNPAAAESPFHGFFTLFWLCMAGMLIKIAAQNWRTYGSPLGNAELINMMFRRDLFVLGVTDCVMCAATLFGVLVQKLVLKGYIKWNREGWIIQNLWQTFYLGAVVGWTVYRDWPWTHTIFVVLHGLVFVMKQHSYAFYNGYLSQVYRRRDLLRQKLEQLEEMEPNSTGSRPNSPSSGMSASAFKLPDGEGIRRRPSMGIRANTKITKEQTQIASIANAIESGQSLDQEQMRAFADVIRREVESLDAELQGKCTRSANSYPSNLTLANWADWTCLPTLVYELEYPRQERINWWYVLEKTLATFGIIWVMMVVSQAYIYPPFAQAVAMKESGLPIEERWGEFPWILSDILFPLLLEQLLSWYLIWECILNVLAELTKFADRGFYGAWWNSETFDQYARDWNRPVHNFLLRHVYHSSISAFHLSKGAATLVTFLLSALVHELVMLCLFKKVRGYLFAMQLLQVPLVTLGRSRLFKGRGALGNVIFWIGMFVGPSFLTSLYLIV